MIDRYEVTISIANWTRVQLLAATHTASLMTTWSSNTIHILLIADDALTFARKIIEILLHPQRAVELGDAASAFAREHFDNNSLVRNMLDVLDSTFAL